MAREGLLVIRPLERLATKDLNHIHQASLDILSEIGINCHNRDAVEAFAGAGAGASPVGDEISNIKIPPKLVLKAIENAPKEIVLGARDPANQLILHGDRTRVYLASGSESNIWLDTSFRPFINKNDPDEEVKLPSFNPRRGTVADLAFSAHLAQSLDTLDAFIRPVNIQDKDINNHNKDVNKFFCCLNNTSKHVMAGLTSLEQLQNVIAMAEIVAGGQQALQNNPIISFITCLVKSPLQMVDDTTQTLIRICLEGLPVVISSSPQAGTTAPPSEAGIVSQINAEVLAGITLTQIINPGTPVIYGSVPVRARLDNLNDAYGAPESTAYNIDCVQMARYYGLPCYSTAGVSDAPIPGLQSAVERLFSSLLVALSGPQYLHCAFGLLDGNSTFSPLQAVMDDTHFKMLRQFLKPADIDPENLEAVYRKIADTVQTSQKLFINDIRPLMRKGKLSKPYIFEDRQGNDSVLCKANQELERLMTLPGCHLPEEIIEKVYERIPGILPRLDTRKSN
ncbi:MAG: trimethylamine methyltransferase family protein [Dehalococcoidaceae bacterium]|nr:trimethylamine methyltransferase family protein [Dehalococcoidaceae bacterium]